MYAARTTVDELDAAAAGSQHHPGHGNVFIATAAGPPPIMTNSVNRDR